METTNMIVKLARKCYVDECFWQRICVAHSKNLACLCDEFEAQLTGYLTVRDGYPTVLITHDGRKVSVGKLLIDGIIQVWCSQGVIRNKPQQAYIIGDILGTGVFFEPARKWVEI
jgi:hypothetical protein